MARAVLGIITAPRMIENSALPPGNWYLAKA
jgi:hypothetical protein